jgi:hypothetical protein
MMVSDGLTNRSSQPLCSRCNVYEACPSKEKRGVDLISDALPFDRLWYGVYDAASNVIETHEQTGDFKE